MTDQKLPEPVAWVLANCGKPPEGKYKDLSDYCLRNIFAQLNGCEADAVVLVPAWTVRERR